MTFECLPSALFANSTCAAPIAIQSFSAEIYSASTIYGPLALPWFADYMHLVFWFFLFTVLILTIWLIQTFFLVVRGGESRFPIRETRGFSRAQTGDILTAIIPMTWSITMLMHASTHSSNFDENTDATLFSLTVIAYQWGWNYFFPADIINSLSKYGNFSSNVDSVTSVKASINHLQTPCVGRTIQPDAVSNLSSVLLYARAGFFMCSGSRIANTCATSFFTRTGSESVKPDNWCAFMSKLRNASDFGLTTPWGAAHYTSTADLNCRSMGTNNKPQLFIIGLTTLPVDSDRAVNQLLKVYGDAPKGSRFLHLNYITLRHMSAILQPNTTTLSSRMGSGLGHSNYTISKPRDSGASASQLLNVQGKSTSLINGSLTFNSKRENPKSTELFRGIGLLANAANNASSADLYSLLTKLNLSDSVISKLSTTYPNYCISASRSSSVNISKVCQFNARRFELLESSVSGLCSYKPLTVKSDKLLSLYLPRAFEDLDSALVDLEVSADVSTTRQSNPTSRNSSLVGGLVPRMRLTAGVVLPSDVPIHLICGSKDVIHSWAIPGLSIKIDCIPGYNCHRRLLIRWRGLFWGQCMEVCGRYHHWMPLLVRVTHMDFFILWLSSLSSQSQ